MSPEKYLEALTKRDEAKVLAEQADRELRSAESVLERALRETTWSVGRNRPERFVKIGPRVLHVTWTDNDIPGSHGDVTVREILLEVQ